MSFGRFIERTKDTVIMLIREQFEKQGMAFDEMPTMEKFNFYSADPYETFVKIHTILPDIDQHLPLISVTVGSSVGRNLGFGIRGDFLGMVRDSDGYYYLRYSSVSEMTVNIDIGTDDENTRTELTDVIIGLFQFYMRERGWEYTPPETEEDLYQIIFDKVVSVTGESEIPRPESDQDDKIYVNRLSFNVMYVSYVDRLAAGQGKLGPGIDEQHRGPIQVLPDPDPPIGNLRWEKK